MENSEKELERVLENPTNLIVSEGLEDLLGDVYSLDEDDLDDSTPEQDFIGRIHLSKDEYVCQIKKIKKKTKKDFVFKVFVPTLPTGHFIESNEFSFSFQGFLFSFEEKGVTYDSDRILTFSARRIIKNEEI